jgi:hypothetical protein
LPLLMNWLVELVVEGRDLSMPTGDIVERFLRWAAGPKLQLVHGGANPGVV